MHIPTWAELEPRIQALLDQPLTAEDMPDFLLACDVLNREVWEAYGALNRAKDEDTADEAAKAAFLAFVQEVMPHLQRIGHALDRKMLAVADYQPPPDLAVRWADLRDDAAMFREQNVPLFTEEQELGQRHGEISGRISVDLGGRSITLAEAWKLLEEPDRELRERAFHAMEAGEEAVRDDMDALFLEMLVLRERIAHNAGFPDYRAYVWKSRHRRDYSPDDTLTLHEAVEKELVPRKRVLMERRRDRLGVPVLRPWDARVDTLSRPALVPFQDVAELQAGMGRVFLAMDPELYGWYRRMDGWMDLEPRPNKVPGLGYQFFFPVSRRAYIYDSAAGSDGDLVTLRHEAGHAFHSFATDANWPLMAHDCTRPEMNEVASFGMELLSLPYLTRDRGGFYDEAGAQRSKAMLMDRIVRLLIFACQVDALQHWLYTQPAEDLTIQAIDDQWSAIHDRFDTGTVDWSGLERAKSKGWQIVHVFQFPFYFLEYAIAYLGALQLWEQALEDPSAALTRYKEALSLGGTRPLDELYRAAGAEFRFDRPLLARLADLVLREMGDEA